MALRTWHALKPYGGGDSPIRLEFSVLRAQGYLDFGFVLAGPLGDLVLPELKVPAARERRDELWKNSCFEMFTGPVNSKPYTEVNLSPAGDWNVYGFDDYRQGMRPLEVPSPFRRVESGMGELRLYGLLPSAAGEVVIGATAVLEYQDGRREYWALKHCGEKPDFHLRESFRLRL